MSKRLSDTELAAEYWHSEAAMGEPKFAETLYRFARCGHYDDAHEEDVIRYVIVTDDNGVYDGGFGDDLEATKRAINTTFIDEGSNPRVAKLVALTPEVPAWSRDISTRRDAFMRECRMWRLMQTQSWWALFVWERRLRAGKWTR